MADREVERLKIVHILPELDLGGVERHVIWLSNELVSMGHEVLVVSGGGKLEEQLDKRVRTFHLPVYQKNPFTGAWSALRLASKIKKEGWQILHAHSRVPAWIAWWTSLLARVPWVVTCHACYSSMNPLIYKPYGRANGAISVSLAVQEHMLAFLPSRHLVIHNGIPIPGGKNELPSFPPEGQPFRLLFVGRLSEVKGIDFALEILSGLKEYPWTLDILGDGPLRKDLEVFVREHHMEERVTFHGIRNDVQSFMARSHGMLFPSKYEGLPLTLSEAVLVGTPVLASDIPENRELLGTYEGLLSLKDPAKWSMVLGHFFKGQEKIPCFDGSRIPTVGSMTQNVLDMYHSCLCPQAKHKRGEAGSGQ